MARTDAGYELRLSTSNPRFDLSRVYQLIDRNRLKSIWADPRSGDLQLGIGCNCHAEAYLWQERWVVIDIKDGPPLAGSAFEKTFAGNLLPPLGDTTQRRPRQRPLSNSETSYDWTKIKPDSKVPTVASDLAGGAQSPPDLADFRNALIANLDREGANGVVRFSPSAAVEPSSTQGAGDDERQFAIGDNRDLTRNGNTCPPHDKLNLADWAEGESPATEMAKSRAAILGEFDRVDRTDLISAVKVHLYYSFGAEARSLLASMGEGQAEDPALWALSYLVDGSLPDENPFVGQETCSGAAALWALAALPAKSASPDVEANAVVQTFMSLPAPLKDLMASDLAAKLQASGKPAQADILLNTLRRSTSGRADTGFLVAAQLALDRNDAELAQQALDGIKDPAQSAQALILRAELAFDQKSAIDPAFVTELEALNFSQGAGPDGPAIARGLALVKSVTGDWTEAFALAASDSSTAQDLWAFLPEGAGDRDFLVQSARATKEDRAMISTANRIQIADRLLALGLPDLATDWISPQDDQPERLATLQLAQRDGRSVLQTLIGIDSATATELRIKAFESLGSFDRAADLLAREGRLEEAVRLRRWAGDWDLPDPIADTPWSALAQMDLPQDSIDAPVSLSSTRSLLTKTEEQVSTIRALLDQTMVD
ncbi:hypothetical protein [Pseudotabrizicola sp. L79]|uniref:hypothetical protein n=1 Tax=Pseudotabrizicola sp. L79 TaxID=3118402 RepID=UPI002F940A23